MQLYSNRVSNSIAGAPLLNYALTISELPLFSFTHLSCSPLCPVLSLHRQPAKPDSRVAYQAFCQPGCLTALSKDPPAFCLPPPPQKKPPEAGSLRPPPVCRSSTVTWLSVCPFYPWLYVFFAHSNLNLIVFPFGPRYFFASDRWP